ncbi:MAG: helix-turn-helix domain-containing protein [Chitinophagaceae bacterium]
MEKTKKELREEIRRLEMENQLLTRQLGESRQSLQTIQSGKIDALVVAHKQNLRIFTEKTADKIYRILIEKMQEGAIALTIDGTILYSNSFFARMIGIQLETVIGSRFSNYVPPAVRPDFDELIRKGWKGYVQMETVLIAEDRGELPVLISVNPLALENTVILSIIISDLSQKNRLTSRVTLVAKLIEVIEEIERQPEGQPRINNSAYISKKLNHSYTYLSDIFKEAKGISIRKYMIINRIEEVKRLLREGDLNLTQISYKLNYSSVSHLSRQFKEITGKLPSEFKNAG